MSHHSAFNNPGLSHSKSNAIALNSLKVSATDVITEHDTNNLRKDDLVIGKISNATSNVGIGNRAANSNSLTLIKETCMLRQDSVGNTHINCSNGKKIYFDVNGAEHFNSNEVFDVVGQYSNILTNNNKVGITTAQSNAIVGNSAKVGITTTQANDITANNSKIGITTQQATDIVNNKTELNNIIIGADVMNYSTGRIGMVSGTTGFSIMNSALNSGILSDEHAGLKQSNQGKTIINGTPNDPISFRKNNVEEYSSNDLKNLVDNITITSNQNLDDHGTKLSILNGRPQLIALTSINPATHRIHHFGYGNGYNYNGSFTDNTFYYIHSNFKVNFTPLGSIVRYKIKCQIDGFYTGRNIYFAVGSSTASSSIIPSTVTFIKGRNSTWTTRKEIIELYEAGLSTSTSYTRFIFCKEVYVSATNAGGTATAGNTGWVIYGGRNNKNVANQTKFYHENDPSPDNPNDTDNFGALECEVWSSPAGYSTSSSTSANYQYLEY